ncbi:type III secretion system chaperone [Candidatus Protochlamydia phocaeensis]|uniref:type III secretion system chaperone n=1 Tax=Candidatus Protochlamydia phocaeensis TaxID=1414722 RepID=UPI000837B443|nr:type III secretion system chaperone [Candidatus Protochlamydia phocaeensis]
MLDALVRQLGQELEMEDLIVSPEPGHYTVPFDENIEVDLIQSPQSYLFKGVIGACPKNNLEAFLLKAMEANLFGRGTRGAAIGLNGEGNLLTLSLELDYNSSYKDFREKMEDFISVLDFWRKEALKHR